MICNFRNFVLQNFPFLEDDFDALTDYELFCKMIEYVKTLVKDNEEFRKQLEDLKNYVYNLNLQNEVNNKLDEMAQDGTLENLIGQYIELMTTYTYNNITEMKLATNLVNGSFARTCGFYTYNDGGSAYYKIRNVTTNDIVDEIFIIKINDTLIAELQFDKEINYLQVGGKVNDETYDSSIIIQALIDKLYEKKAGKIYLPCGNLYCKNTIVLKSNVELIGFGNYSIWNYNASVWQDKITTIHYNGTLQKDLFITNLEDTSQMGYQPNINLKNLYIIGNENTLNGLNLIGLTKSNIENITIINCINNIHISFGMTTNFKSVYSQRASNYCLLIDSENIGGNTTLNFYDCYFGQTRETNGIPLKIASESVISGNFINCVFESSNNSIEIDTKNDINFNNLYVENIPETGNNPTFKIGESDITSQDKGNINIIGGSIMGTNGEINDNMCLFDINYISNFTLINTPLKRSKYSFKLNANTGKITCVGVNETQIAYGLNYYKDSNKIAYFNCNNNSVPLGESTYIPKMTLPRNRLTLENGWTIYGNGVNLLKFGNFVILDFSATAGTVSNSTKIATIPSEYRPINTSFINLFDLSYAQKAPVDIRIDTNGDVYAPNGLTQGRVYTGLCIYLINN